LIRRTPVIDVAMEFSRCTRASARPAYESPVIPVSQNSTAYAEASSRSTFF